MSNKEVFGEITPQDKQDIINFLGQINSKLSFLIDLNKDERNQMRSTAMSQARKGYADEVLNALNANPQVLPGYFELARFEQKIKLLDDMDALMSKWMPLAEKLDDSLLALGSDIYRKANDGYDALKKGAEKNQALNSVVEKIGKLFERASRAPEETPPAEEEGGEEPEEQA